MENNDNKFFLGIFREQEYIFEKKITKNRGHTFFKI